MPWNNPKVLIFSMKFLNILTFPSPRTYLWLWTGYRGRWHTESSVRKSGQCGAMHTPSHLLWEETEVCCEQARILEFCPGGWHLRGGKKQSRQSTSVQLSWSPRSAVRGGLSAPPQTKLKKSPRLQVTASLFLWIHLMQGHYLLYDP